MLVGTYYTTKKHFSDRYISLFVENMVVNQGSAEAKMDPKTLFFWFYGVVELFDWPQSGLFRFYSLRSVFWYQNQVPMTVQWDFMLGNMLLGNVLLGNMLC